MKNQPKSRYYVACSPSGYHVFKRGRKYAILCDLTWEEANRWRKKLNNGEAAHELPNA